MATLGHHTLNTFVLTEMCLLPPQCWATCVLEHWDYCNTQIHSGEEETHTSVSTFLSVGCTIIKLTILLLACKISLVMRIQSMEEKLLWGFIALLAYVWQLLRYFGGLFLSIVHETSLIASPIRGYLGF